MTSFAIHLLRHGAPELTGRMLGHGDVPVFRTAAELYAAMPEVGLVAICTPPGVRHALVREAIDAGKDVLLEKPPTPTITEFQDLVAYGEAMTSSGHRPIEPAKLAGAMLARFMSTDRAFAKLRRAKP